jgi:prepilin-type processing-associated H-X9-DG protein
LAGAKGKAKTAACLSSTRQWGLAVHLYATDNDDKLPRDGMGENGTYPGNLYNGIQTGHPTDPNAWFNLLPPNVGERPLSKYFVSPGNPSFSQNSQTLPFPGGEGKFWHCSAARMSPSEAPANGGRFGFFSYVMNIDLKKRTAIDNYTYPRMPLLDQIHRPVATVLMFDAVFNPRTEVVNASPQFNSVNPANRWRSFARRHNDGGNITFVDGHSQYFKLNAVQAGAGNNEGPNPDIIWNAPYRDDNP